MLKTIEICHLNSLEINLALDTQSQHTDKKQWRKTHQVLHFSDLSCLSLVHLLSECLFFLLLQPCCLHPHLQLAVLAAGNEASHLGLDLGDGPHLVMELSPHQVPTTTSLQGILRLLFWWFVVFVRDSIMNHSFYLTVISWEYVELMTYLVLVYRIWSLIFIPLVILVYILFFSLSTLS